MGTALVLLPRGMGMRLETPSDLATKLSFGHEKLAQIHLLIYWAQESYNVCRTFWNLDGDISCRELAKFEIGTWLKTQKMTAKCCILSWSGSNRLPSPK